jgi:nucleoside-diphosphate-sugar epimerase
MWHQRAHVDCSRALRELGLKEFIPLERSLKDFAERLLDLGVIPRLPPPVPAAGQKGD